MNLLSVLCFIFWIYILSVFKRGKLDFFYFIFGSVGLFVFMLIWIQPILTDTLTKGVAAVSGILGEFTGYYDSYFQYGLLFIKSNKGTISLYIDYECSGIIEIMAFSSMLWFFSIYKLQDKIIVNILGFFWIFAANVIRIFSICVLIYHFGNNMFFFAHTIFGRIIFYALSIALYFYVFTKPQIKRQKVGKFDYGVNQ